MRVFLPLALSAILVSACSARSPDLRPEDGPAQPPPAPKTTLEQLRPFLSQREKDYPLYPGDVVRITVQGHEDLTVERKIPAGGSIPILGARPATDPRAGAPLVIPAAGKSIPEIEEELRELYSATITNPYVTVRVTSFAAKRIYVTGAVKSPNEYQIPDEERISLVQALTKAGWFADNAARDRVRVIRRNPETSRRIVLPPIDVGKIVGEGQVEMDILLEPGDTVTVDSRPGQVVSIFGYVQSPGEIPYVEGITLTRLITRVGGLKDFAKKSNVRVIRSSKGPEPRVFFVDLESVFDGEAPDFPLAPGDVVYVDETFF